MKGREDEGKRALAVGGLAAAGGTDLKALTWNGINKIDGCVRSVFQLDGSSTNGDYHDPPVGGGSGGTMGAIGANTAYRGGERN